MLVDYNLQRYHECKHDDTKLSFGDGERSYGYYLVALEWMGEWRQFVNGKGRVPGQIDNYMLKRRIQQARERLGHPDHDDDLGLSDKVHFYILSVNFFKFFYDTYGCNQIIAIKYQAVHESVEINPDPLRESHGQLSPNQNVQKGLEVTAVFEDLKELQANPLLREMKLKATEIKSRKTATARHSLEYSAFREASTKQYKGRYLLSQRWLSQWLHYQEAGQDGTLGRRNVQAELESLLEEEQQALADRYVKQSKPYSGREVECLNFRAWYLLYFLYARPKARVPLLVKSSEYPEHVEMLTSGQEPGYSR